MRSLLIADYILERQMVAYGESEWTFKQGMTLTTTKLGPEYQALGHEAPMDGINPLLLLVVRHRVGPQRPLRSQRPSQKT